ncbi:hypothetical protein [Nocardioides sp.]|uniref:hypothetical protein n=1 Tax=Nocardioides sp. TaxID=35761 RepID=UPI003519A197
MSTEMRVHWAHLDDLIGSMAELGRQSAPLVEYFGEHVCDPSGFDFDTCALQPIGAVLPPLSDAFVRAQNGFVSRWTEVQNAILSSARDLATTDAQQEEVFRAYLAEGLFGIIGAAGPDGPRLASFDDVGDALAAPSPGRSHLRHPAKFDAIADGWEGATGLINDFIGMINRFGAGLPQLPENLREHIVYPLSADYEKLGANADACAKFHDGMAVWSDNFLTLGGKVDAAIEGRTALALVGHIDAYAAVARGIGTVVESGARIWTTIARFSERIAVQVERVLTILGERLLKVAARVGSKMVPLLGWASLAVDLAKHGLGIVADIVDDIREIFTLIEACLGLADDIKSWAEAQSDRLRALQRVMDLVEQLPGVSAQGRLADANDAAGRVRDRADGLAEDAGRAADTDAGSVIDELERITGEAEDDGESADADFADVGPGETIIAPGPLGGPHAGGSTSGGVSA